MRDGSGQGELSDEDDARRKRQKGESGQGELSDENDARRKRQKGEGVLCEQDCDGNVIDWGYGKFDGMYWQLRHGGGRGA